MTIFTGVGFRVPFDAKAQIERALNELKRRGVKDDYCIRCENPDFNVDLIEIPATSFMAASVPLGGNYLNTGATKLSVLAVVCNRCGYMVLHNLEMLGLGGR